VDFLLIRRRDSLGYIDILRGKYKLTDTEYIKQQLRGMTFAEQQNLLTHPFDTLWQTLWGPPTEGSNSYKHEKEQSRQKLDALRSGTGCTSLKELLASLEGQGWDTPEWGFPKGRRDLHETEYACAVRELWEETGVRESEITPIRNLEPIREVFFGSNHVQYCHKYYIFFMSQGREVSLDPTNVCMQREIGDLRWCSLEEALVRIRPENVEKREILLRVSRLLRNYCPLFAGAGAAPPRPLAQS
jgi:8-oxo-dGTP pyrophosphatase MutT (NUDIX family)